MQMSINVDSECLDDLLVNVILIYLIDKRSKFTLSSLMNQKKKPY